MTENDSVAECYYAGNDKNYSGSMPGYTSVYAPDEGYNGTTNLIVWCMFDGNTYLRYVPVDVKTPWEWGEDGAGQVPEQLTISVTWEDDPNPQDPKRTEYTYSMEQLSQMSNEYYTYTIIGTADTKKRYCYMTARGVRLVALLNDCGIYEQDIKYLDFKATDAMRINSSTMGMDFFLKPRYYYPNIYKNGSTSGAQVVPALIAVSSRMYWYSENPSNRDWMPELIANKVNTYAEIGGIDSWAPRLCIGAVSPRVTGGKISVRNVEVINVVLAGAPPYEPEKPPIPGDGGDGNGGDGDKGGDGDGNNGQSGGAGGGTSGGTGSGDSGNNPAQGKGSGAQAGVDMQGNSGIDAGGQQNVQSNAETAGGGGDDGGENEPEQAAGSSAKEAEWRVYQMMSNAQTQADITDVDRALRFWAFPLADIVLAAAAIRYLVWYRREKRPPRPASV